MEDTLQHSSDNRVAGGSRSKPFIFQQLDTTAKFPYPTSFYVKRVLWEVVQATLIRLSLRRAHGWRRFWLRVFGAKMHDTAMTKSSTNIKHPWLLEMGYFTVLAEDVVVYNLGPLWIGDHTVVSQNVHICNGTHDYTQPNLPLLRPTARIGHGVWICADAFIGPGVTVGDNSIVGARACVMRDVPPGVIVSGNPAKVVKERPMGGRPSGESSEPARTV